MKSKKQIGTKLLLYFGGLIIMTLGVGISVKSDLGVTPISSIPYTLTVVLGMDLGIATIIFSVFMVMMQIVILRKKYKIINLLQLPVGILFGIFLTFSCKFMNIIPDPTNFTIQFIIMLISTIFVAFGVFLYVPAGFIPLAPEGFILALSKTTNLKFSTIKVISDVVMVMVSLVTCLVIIHSCGSVGIGTIVAAVLVGTEVKLLTKFCGQFRDRVLCVDSVPDQIANDLTLTNIMEKEVYTIRNDSSIEDALRMMKEKKVSGLPVVNSDGKLVGFISDGDIIRQFSSKNSFFVNSNSFDRLEFNKELDDIMLKKVSSIAEKHVITVNEADDLSDVCYKLVEYGLKKAPVIHGEKMIGIINVSNIIKYAVTLIDNSRCADHNSVGDANKINENRRV